MNAKDNNQNFDLIELLLFLYKNKLPIIIITVFGAIASLIASFTITPMYKSTVILFPASNGSLSKSLLSEGISRNDLYSLGEEEDAEKLLQILNSYYIRDKVIDTFKLFKHYDIDINAAYPYTKIYDEFSNNVTYKKTRFQSIEIKVMDKDPQMAANIANTISALVDTVFNTMINERAAEAYLIVKKGYVQLKDSLESVEKELTALKKMGILDHWLETESYSRAFSEGLAQGKLSAKARKEFEEKFGVLAEYGARYILLNDILQNLSIRFSDVQQRLTEAKINMSNTIPRKFVVNKAKVAEKKAYPVRWLICVGGTLAAFVFSIAYILFKDLYVRFKHKLLSNN